MSNDGDAPVLEERRLALEELKAQHDYELRDRELDLKRSETGWVSRLFTPLTTTVFAGILTFAASAVGTLIQSRNALDPSGRNSRPTCSSSSARSSTS
jgi:hypothetical protein